MVTSRTWSQTTCAQIVAIPGKTQQLLCPVSHLYSEGHNGSDVRRLAGGVNNIWKVLRVVATHRKHFVVFARSIVAIQKGR